MKIPKMTKIVYRQMLAPRDLPIKSPPPKAKIKVQNHRNGGKFLVQIPGVRGGMVMAKKLTAALGVDNGRGGSRTTKSKIPKLFPRPLP